MRICEYGCGQEAKFSPSKGKPRWCCSKFYQSCPEVRKNTSITTKQGMNNKKTREKIRIAKIGVKQSKQTINKRVLKLRGHKHSRLTIRKIKKKYPFFSDIEDLRYNPDKPLEEKEIQVHCKNHNCSNSKEKGGWFIPTKIQISERIRQLESLNGNDGSYFYCSDSCKNKCILYHSKGIDPFRNIEKVYTQHEYEIFRQEVLNRQLEEDGKNFCEKCYSIKKIHVHHEKSIKTHPHLALDPDNGIVLCEKCHYKYGHKTETECSTGALANKIQIDCTLGSRL